MPDGEQAEPTSLRTRVYVDGYNFYYGCLKGTSFKWLDLYKLFETHVLPSILVEHSDARCDSKLLPEALLYFTAKIIERAAKAPDSVACQARYHTALRKLYDGRVRIVEGYYSLTQVRAPLINNAHPDWPVSACARVPIWKLEEKQSDVNLALHAYHDALTNQVDHVVIVSNDTDLAPALRMIREHTGAVIGLVIPTRDQERKPNADLAKYAHWIRRHLTDAELVASQLPRVVPGGKSPTVKPDSWYPQPELFQQALELAIGVRGKRSSAFQWLETESEHLGGNRPIDLFESEDGAKRVIRYMNTWIASNSDQATAEASEEVSTQSAVGNAASKGQILTTDLTAIRWMDCAAAGFNDIESRSQ